MLARITMRRLVAASLAASCVLLVAVGCSSSGGGEGTGGENPTQRGTPTQGGNSARAGSTAENSPDETTSISIVVAHYPTVMQSIPYIVGMKKGFFDDAGITISDISGSSGGGTTVRALINGDLSFGVVSTAAGVKAALAGAPLKFASIAIASLADQPIVVRKNSDIHTVKDLIGKKVAYTHPGSVTQGALVLSLLGAGIDPAKVNTIASGGLGNSATLLDQNAIAGAVLSEPTFALNSDGKRILYLASKYAPQFAQTVVVPSSNIAKNNPELVTSFLTARMHAIEWIKSHQDQAGAMWAKEAKMDPALGKKVVKQVLTAAPDYYRTGFTVKAMSAVDTEMRAINLIGQDTQVPWSELIDQSFLPKGVTKIDSSKIKSK